MARKRARIEGVASGKVLAKEERIPESGGDEPVAADDDVFPEAGDIVPVAEGDFPEAGKEFLAPSPPSEDVPAASLGPQSVASLAEEDLDGSAIDPVAGIVEAAVTEDFEVLEELGTEGLKAAESAASSFAGNFQLFAAEAKDYSKTSMESRAAFLGALLGAKSLENAVQLQTSYIKSAAARYLAHLMKISGLYWTLLGEVSKTAGRAIAKPDRTKA